MDKIAILIPCYNESATIEKVVNDCKKIMPDASIYVYDNNSTDGTDEIARNAGAKVLYEYRQGKGNVIRSMFSDIDAQCYIMLDGDDTYPPEAMPKLAEAVLERNADMVIGDRLSSSYFIENKRLFHNFGNKLVRKMINKLFKSDIKDILTGYRAFSYEFVKSFPILSTGFEIETEMTVHALDKNMHIENILVDYRDRPEGSESKLSTIKDGIRVIKKIVNLYQNYKPLEFFSIIAFILFAIAILFLVPVMITYFQTGLVPRFPTFIASGLFAIATLQSLFSGIILNVLRHKERSDFEMQLINLKRDLRNIKKI